MKDYCPTVLFAFVIGAMAFILGAAYFQGWYESPASPVACNQKAGRQLFWVTQRAFDGQSEPKKFTKGPGVYEKSLIDETWHLIDERKMPLAD